MNLTKKKKEKKKKKKNITCRKFERASEKAKSERAKKKRKSEKAKKRKSENRKLEKVLPICHPLVGIAFGSLGKML